ncbi:MAG: alkaline phosphatase family protein [Gemmataceae bacterium]
MPAATDPIQHVIVLMLENRSFDQMLGILKVEYPELEGIDPTAPRRSNVDHEGNRFEQIETRETVVDPDPHHDLASVLQQIEAQLPKPKDLAPNYSLMERIWRGLAYLCNVICSYLKRKRPVLKTLGARPYEGNFVAVYSVQQPPPTTKQRQQIMAYYPLGFLPAMHALAHAFTICDHWFSSLPGSTWPNRLFVHSGTSLGRASTPEIWHDFKSYHLYDQPTIYDRLTEAGITWRIYHDGLPQTLSLANQQKRENAACYRKMEHFESDAQHATEFPQYVFIEPCYKPHGNDDHPPNDTMNAQQLIADVYNAIKANGKLWDSTLLVIIYDEHGGFYDHVTPPDAVPPDGHHVDYTFTQLGVRVPALLVSPWVGRGVFSKQLDHTSLLRYLSDKWKLGPLGKRVTAASSFEDAILSTRRPDNELPPPLEMPIIRMAAAAPEQETVNENQKGLIQLAHFLESKTEPEPSVGSKRAMMQEAPPRSQLEVAEDQVQRFLDG